MSEDNPDSNNKEEKSAKRQIEYKRVSVAFVDSVFTQVGSKVNEKDPLNPTAQEFYSRQPKKSQNKQNTPEYSDDDSSSSSESVEVSKTPPTEEKKQKSNVSNNNNNNNKNEEKSSTSSKNNYNNSYKQKKLMYNSSAKNISKTNKDLKNKSNKTNIRDLNKGKKTYSAINENYLNKIQSDKEKKFYQEKVRILENRIMALKKHEDIIHRRMHCNDVRQTYLNQKKKEKSDMKQALLSHDIDKRNELDIRRKAIKEQKNNEKKHLKESMEKSKMAKMKDYENMQKEKKLALSIINENNNKIEEYGRGNVKKIKKEREQIKKNENKRQKNLEKTADNFYIETYEDNKLETNKLKNKLKKLEKLEMKYLNSLNKTRQGMIRNNSQGVNLYKKDMPPISKLDLEKQMDKTFSGKDKHLKKNHKNTASVDKLNKYYNNNDKDNDKENVKNIKEENKD